MFTSFTDCPRVSAGNGKRSDPRMDEASNPSLLRQLLLRNSPVYSSALEASVDIPAEAEDSGSSYDSEYPDYPVPVARPVDRLTALLRTLVGFL